MAADRYTAKKAAQGYLSPRERDGCHSCRHLAPQRYDLTPYCRLGAMWVAATAICNHHQPAGVAGQKEA